MSSPSERKIDLSQRPPLLAPLRLFECSIIARFLPAKTKLLVISLLNTSWNSLVSKNYAWTHLPTLTKHCSLTSFLSFVERFEHLKGITVH